VIKNFNFYDVYGYFLPGLVLLTLIWLPFGVNGRLWPAKELASALIAVPLAYVVGHILQTIAALSMSARVKKQNESARYPSDLLLDVGDDKTFSVDFKNQLAEQIKALFKLDVNDNDADKRIRNRQDAFFLCRSTLIGSKAASYGEQFEGMYTLMRGLAGSFAISFVYYIGWGVGDLAFAGNKCYQKWGLAIGFVGLIGAILFTVVSESSSERSVRFKKIYWMLGSLFVGVLSIGSYLGSKINSHRPGILFIIAFATLLASLKSYGSFRYFAWEFAKAIYRDFYNHREIKRELEKDRSNATGTEVEDE
jgi:hypothetical protein